MKKIFIKIMLPLILLTSTHLHSRKKTKRQKTNTYPQFPSQFKKIPATYLDKNNKRKNIALLQSIGIGKYKVGTKLVDHLIGVDNAGKLYLYNYTNYKEDDPKNPVNAQKYNIWTPVGSTPEGKRCKAATLTCKGTIIIVIKESSKGGPIFYYDSTDGTLPQEKDWKKATCTNKNIKFKSIQGAKKSLSYAIGDDGKIYSSGSSKVKSWRPFTLSRDLSQPKGSSKLLSVNFASEGDFASSKSSGVTTWCIANGDIWWLNLDTGDKYKPQEWQKVKGYRKRPAQGLSTAGYNVCAIGQQETLHKGVASKNMDINKLNFQQLGTGASECAIDSSGCIFALQKATSKRGATLYFFDSGTRKTVKPPPTAPSATVEEATQAQANAKTAKAAAQKTISNASTDQENAKSSYTHVQSFTDQTLKASFDKAKTDYADKANTALSTANTTLATGKTAFNNGDKAFAAKKYGDAKQDYDTAKKNANTAKKNASSASSQFQAYCYSLAYSALTAAQKYVTALNTAYSGGKTAFETAQETFNSPPTFNPAKPAIPKGSYLDPETLLTADVKTAQESYKNANTNYTTANDLYTTAKTTYDTYVKDPTKVQDPTQITHDFNTVLINAVNAITQADSATKVFNDVTPKLTALTQDIQAAIAWQKEATDLRTVALAVKEDTSYQKDKLLTDAKKIQKKVEELPYNTTAEKRKRDAYDRTAQQKINDARNKELDLERQKEQGIAYFDIVAKSKIFGEDPNSEEAAYLVDNKMVEDGNETTENTKIWTRTNLQQAQTTLQQVGTDIATWKAQNLDPFENTIKKALGR